MPEVVPSPRDKRNSFDSLRLLFASLVIFSHSFSLLGLPDPLRRLTGQQDFGGIAVDGFFLISGYLITQSWLADQSPARYLAKRVLRIYPAFVVASLLSIFVAGPLGAADATVFLRHVDLPKVLRALVTLRAPQTPPTFVGSVIDLVNGAMWTISFEFRCYLLVLLLALLRVFRARIALLVIAAGAVTWATVAAPIPGPTDSQHFIFGLPALRLSDSMLWFFALFATGSCFYTFRDRIGFSVVRISLAAVVLCGGLFSIETVRPSILIAGAYVVFGIASMWKAAPGRKDATDRSYGLYLYGWPVAKIISWYIPGIGPWELFVATYLATFIMATASWHFIEKPMLHLKPRRGIASEASAAATVRERADT